MSTKTKPLKRFHVVIPFTGFVVFDVEAMDKKAAAHIAFHKAVHEMEDEDILQMNVHGNAISVANLTSD